MDWPSVSLCVYVCVCVYVCDCASTTETGTCTCMYAHFYFIYRALLGQHALNLCRAPSLHVHTCTIHTYGPVIWDSVYVHVPFERPVHLETFPSGLLTS